ncbi:MAG: hypothetical protein AAF268_13020 [Cyanobacteria bacterium P01_A01_bin.3]
MISLLSKILSPSSSDWSARLREPMLEVEHFYRSRTDISYYDRRRIAKQRLCRLDGITPFAAKTVLKQWDKRYKLKPKKRSHDPELDFDLDLDYDLELDEVGIDEEIPELLDTAPKPLLRLGESLLGAGLINPSQIQVALMDAQYREDLRLGEILALRGWIYQETADFFAEKLPTIVTARQKQPIGEYLVDARLLDLKQVDTILHAQRRQSVRFGELAVARNFIKQQTVDFLLQYLP